MHIAFDAELYIWSALDDASWYFVSVPEELSGMVAELPRPVRGFGAVRVEATIGGSTWRTSILPSGGTYVLPVKKAVRTAETIDEGDVASVELLIIDA